jgi:hypothetical protein
MATGVKARRCFPMRKQAKTIDFIRIRIGSVRGRLERELRSRDLKSKHVRNASKNEPILVNRLSPVYTISGSGVSILPADCLKFAQSRACGVA